MLRRHNQLGMFLKPDNFIGLIVLRRNTDADSEVECAKLY